MSFNSWRHAPVTVNSARQKIIPITEIVEHEKMRHFHQGSYLASGWLPHIVSYSIRGGRKENLRVHYRLLAQVEVIKFGLQRN